MRLGKRKGVPASPSNPSDIHDLDRIIAEHLLMVSPTYIVSPSSASSKLGSMADLETASTAVHMQQRLCLGLKGGGRKVKRVPADEPTTTPSTMDRGAAVSEATQVAPRRTETKDVANQFMSSQTSVWRSGSAAECGDFDVEEGSQPRRRYARTTRRRVVDGLRGAFRTLATWRATWDRCYNPLPTWMHSETQLYDTRPLIPAHHLPAAPAC